jgi:hypothetical protein
VGALPFGTPASLKNPGNCMGATSQVNHAAWTKTKLEGYLVQHNRHGDARKLNSPFTNLRPWIGDYNAALHLRTILFRSFAEEDMSYLSTPERGPSLTYRSTGVLVHARGSVQLQLQASA